MRLRYKWLTLRRPKPKLHLKLSIDKKEAAYGHMTHWEGALTVEIMRATGVRAVDLREESPFHFPALSRHAPVLSGPFSWYLQSSPHPTLGAAFRKVPALHLSRLAPFVADN